MNATVNATQARMIAVIASNNKGAQQGDMNPDRSKAIKKINALSPAQAARLEQYIAPVADHFFSVYGVDQKVSFRSVDFALFCMTGDVSILGSTSLFAVSAICAGLLGVTDKDAMYSLAGSGARFNNDVTFNDPLLAAKLKRVIPSVGAGSASSAKSHSCKVGGVLDCFAIAKPTREVPVLEKATLNRAILRDFVKQISTMSDYTAQQLQARIKGNKE